MITSYALAASHLIAFRKSVAYDVLMRLPILTWSIGLAIVSVVEFAHYRQTADPNTQGFVYALNIAMRISMIAYLVILGATVAVRKPPLRRACGAEPRITALCGSFLITAIVLFPLRDLSLPLGCLSTSLVIFGDFIATIVLVQLRGSFSIMAEARQLITSGTYRIVRHPLYLAEEFATIGGVIQHLSIWTSMLLLVQIICQVRRMTNEEAILMDTFSEYQTYKRNTARIIPGLY